MKALIIAALVLSSACTHAANDSTYLDYLANKGLTAAECAERSPRDLFGWVSEREKLGYTGTPNHEQTTIDAFYRRYLEALAPHVVTTAPATAAARGQLREVLYLISDFYGDLTRARAYITHERCDAYGEHLLLCLAGLHGGRVAAAAITNPSSVDVVHFARAKAAMKQGGGVPPAEFDAFCSKLRSGLDALERALPDTDRASIRFLIMDFADIHEELLNPNVFQRISG